MSPETINLINVIIEVIIALLVISIPVGLITGIVLLSTRNASMDKKKKSMFTTWGIILIVAPFALLFIILSLWGLVRIMTNSFGV